MEDSLSGVVAAGENLSNRSIDSIDKLFAVAQPDAVFSEPVQAGNSTIITASEVTVGMGLGFGSGFGAEEEEEDSEIGSGFGGGGGGFTAARPVAAIIVDEQGVYIEPIVDSTKIAIAFFAAISSMLVMITRLNSGRG